MSPVKSHRGFAPLAPVSRFALIRYRSASTVDYSEGRRSRLNEFFCGSIVRSIDKSFDVRTNSLSTRSRPRKSLTFPCSSYRGGKRCDITSYYSSNLSGAGLRASDQKSPRYRQSIAISRKSSSMPRDKYVAPRASATPPT